MTVSAWARPSRAINACQVKTTGYLAGARGIGIDRVLGAISNSSDGRAFTYQAEGP